MADINITTVSGRLTRDPETREFQNSSKCGFSAACGRKFKVGDETREETMFLECELWNNAGEYFAKVARKGARVIVSGRLKLEQWEKDGVKRQMHKLVVESFQLIDYPPREGDDQSQDERPRQQQQQRPASKSFTRSSAPSPGAPYSDEPEFRDDDIPF